MFPKILLLIAFALVTGCSRSFGNTISDADIVTQVNAFHRDLDAMDASAVLERADQVMLQTDNVIADLSAELTITHLAKGAVKGTELYTHQEVDDPDHGHLAQVVMKTHFEKGDAYEKFVFRMDGPDLKLAGYEIKEQLGDDASVESGGVVRLNYPDSKST